MRTSARQSGFVAVAAIVVVVIMSALATAILKFGAGQQLGSAQDILSARAWQAAKAGTEWGLYQALQPTGIWHTAAGCNGSPRTLDLRAAGGFLVGVTCAASDYDEGEKNAGGSQTMRSLVITATACTSSTQCPDNTAALNPGYVERMRRVIAFCPVGTDPGDCAL